MIDWLDLFAVQGTLKSLLQHHSSKASILQHSAFFIVQLSHPYMTTGKTTALTKWIFVGKVTSLLFNMLSRLVITFLPRSKRLLISWPQSPSAVILEPPKIVCHCFPINLPWSDGTYSPGVGNGNPFQCSCLKNPMDRGAWGATVPRVTKSRTWQSTPTGQILNMDTVPTVMNLTAQQRRE